uniref:Putative ribonuclease H-like domain-containing protein n=1 Tax=Tanacetum cinerariifolium TaxID=118510 RepID=A0A699ILV5_TANCI|nr:putative ribonuclease H-like domain-containing protein [Tanacetum cinerariifolium]
MNQFCEMKGIKRKFSVAMTPQQNGVAVRKNKTLIEAARTMLADSKLSTTSWAEAVNIAFYDSPGDGSKPSKEEKEKDTKNPGNEESKAPITEEPKVNQEKDNVNNTKCQADLNNMETTFQVSPISITRIYKDYPVEQIIGDIHSAPQTRRMIKNVTNHDYDEVFAPVARIEVIRLFLACALFKDFVVYHMDVKSVFLYGKIEEEVYACQPSGFKDPEFPDRVYKVEKALYGLHQAPRAWYKTLSSYLLDNEFQRGQIDKTLFIKRVKDDILLVQVYVNDIIFGSTRKEICTEFKKMMHKKFQMSSMGELIFFLGLQVTQKDNEMFISQDKYVDEVLKKFGLSAVKTTSTPIKTSKPLLKNENAEDVDVHLYRLMIAH